jgi:hypothetical protein
MRRREFIVGLASTAAWPVLARGQQRAAPAIGLLHISSLALWFRTPAALCRPSTVSRRWRALKQPQFCPSKTPFGFPFLEARSRLPSRIAPNRS